MEVSKNDWKLFRSKIVNWQENYMDRLNKGYIELLNSDKNSADKFWELERRIKKDMRHPGVIIEMRKSEMIFNIVILLRDGVIKFEDLDGFSEELKERVQFMVGR